MDVEILEMALRPCRIKVACLKVRYGQLILKLDLVYYAKEHRAWVRMPEKWLTKEHKTTYCYWPSKEISDEFQKDVLNKTFDKYGLDLEKIKLLHIAGCKAKSVTEVAEATE